MTAALREQAAVHAIEQARAERMPSIRLQAGYRWTNVGLTGSDDRGGLVAKIVGSIPLYTGGGVEAEIRASQYRRDAARHQSRDTRAQVRTAVVQSWSQMIALRSAVRAVTAQKASVREALAGISAARKVGPRTVFEQIVAQQAVLAAETSLEQIERTLYLSTCRVALLSGLLDVSAIAASEVSRVDDTRHKEAAGRMAATKRAP